MANYTEGMLDSIRDIASLAYGSGFFEKAKGGEGYMGAFVDSHTGNVRVVKMLTHSSEYAAVKKAGGEAAFVKVNDSLGQSTQTLKDTLLRIATASKDKKILDKVTELLDDKPLLSRKLVAKVVNALTEGLDKTQFSWKTAGDEARTFADTRLESVVGDNAKLENYDYPEQMRFKTLGRELVVDVKGTDGETAEICAGRAREGKFSQAWCDCWNASTALLIDQMEEVFHTGQSSALLGGVDCDLNAPGLDQMCKTFHTVLRTVVAKDIEAQTTYPLSDDQRTRLLARAAKKAFVIMLVQRNASQMIDKLEKMFPVKTGGHENRAAAYARCRERINDVNFLLNTYETHLGFEALKNDPSLDRNFNTDSVDLVRDFFAGDVMTLGDMASAEDGGKVADLALTKPKLSDDEADVAAGILNFFEVLNDRVHTGAKNLLGRQISYMIGHFAPPQDYQGVDVSGTQQKSDFDDAIRTSGISLT